MDNNIDKYEPEEIKLPVLEMRMNKLGDTLLSNATNDREEARKIKQFIEQEISEIKAEYEQACTEYRSKIQTAEAIEDPFVRKDALSKIWKPKRPNITLLISEMNKALEVSINSSDNIVKLLDVLAKVKLKSKETSNFDEIELSKKRLTLLKDNSENTK